VPLGSRLRQAAKYGIKDPRLAAAEPPEGLERIYEVFWDLYKVERLTYLEVEAYERVTGETLTPFIVKALMRMDATAAAYMGERANPKHRLGSKPAEVDNG